jgi:hypothetical protein
MVSDEKLIGYFEMGRGGDMVYGMEMGCGGYVRKRVCLIWKIEQSVSWSRQMYNFHASLLLLDGGMQKT